MTFTPQEIRQLALADALVDLDRRRRNPGIGRGRGGGRPRSAPDTPARLRRRERDRRRYYSRKLLPKTKGNNMSHPDDVERTECEWMNEEASEDGRSWGAGCGRVFYLDDGDPAANGMKFCPFCGGRLTRTYHEGQGE